MEYQDLSAEQLLGLPTHLLTTTVATGRSQKPRAIHTAGGWARVKGKRSPACRRSAASGGLSCDNRPIGGRLDAALARGKTAGTFYPAWSAFRLNKIKSLLMPLLIIILVGIGSAVIFSAVGERSYRYGEFGFGCSVLTLVYFLHRRWARQTPA